MSAGTAASARASTAPVSDPTCESMGRTMPPRALKVPAKNTVVGQYFEDGSMVLRRARKQHRCSTLRREVGPRVRAWDGGALPDGHSGLIEIGEQYVEYLGESPLYESGYRYCRSCAIAAGIVTEAS